LALVLLLLQCIPLTGLKEGTTGARMYKSKWKPVVHTIHNLDSLICEYIERNDGLEFCKKTFEMLSESQKNALNMCIRYSGNNVVFIGKEVPETQYEHPTRLSFIIYDKYYDRLSAGDYALEITVTRSFVEGTAFLYLLKKNGSGYTISFLIGERKI